MLTIQAIQEARERIAPYIVETPMIRLQALDGILGCEVYIKAENMQITGAFKLRGALNRALSLTAEERRNGLVCASSGNHGKGVAYAAKLLGTKATVIMPLTASKVKLDALRKLGAEVVQCDVTERFAVAEKICSEQGAVMVPPFNNEYVMAGQGTAGLEIAQQCPEVDKVIIPVSGGGLLSGVAVALKETLKNVKVYGAEPAALPRYTESLAAGEMKKVEFKPTLADALMAQTPGDKCFPTVQKYVDGVVPVTDEDMFRGMKLLLTEGKILAEPSSCIGIGAVLRGTLKVEKGEKVCFLISGGGVGLDQIAKLEEITY